MNANHPHVSAEDVAAPARKSRSPFARSLRRFMRNWTAVAGLAWILLVLLTALLAPVLAQHDPAAQGNALLAGPSGEHWLGTDDLGRDVASRMIYASRIALRISLQIAVLSLLASLVIGLFSGFRGGMVDQVLMRIIDGISSFPALVFAIAIAAVLGPGINNATLAIAVITVPGLARLIRGQTLAIREETFVEASRSIGTPTRTVLIRRVLPSLASPIIVQTTILLGVALLAEAALSFIGLGIQPPDPSWGQMLRRSYDHIFQHPLMMVPPGLAIALTVLAWNVIGDGLRDSMGHQPAHTPRRYRKGAVLGATSVRPDGPLPMPPTTDAVLSVRDLRVRFATDHGIVTVVDGISFDVGPGEVLGLVGESGSGKSMTSLGIMRLIPSPPGWIGDGSVTLNGEDVLRMAPKELRQIRGEKIAMVYQDPMASLNPAFTIGNQLIETIRLHRDCSKKEARTRSLELLTQVGLSDPEVRLRQYPHELSGGMRQRVVIAQALACDPDLLIADEPTTALDVTIQAEILDLLKRLQRDRGMAMIFVTHDLGVVADVCDRVAVMYAGQIVEQAPVEELFARPRHPYTKALLAAMPQLAAADERLVSIPGVVPLPADLPAGCRFGPRCTLFTDACSEPVELRGISVHQIRCVRADVPDVQKREEVSAR